MLAVPTTSTPQSKHSLTRRGRTLNKRVASTLASSLTLVQEKHSLLAFSKRAPHRQALGGLEALGAFGVTCPLGL